MKYNRFEIWWERRRENEPTCDYLARVLDEAGLEQMAAAAKRAHYDDYFAPAEVDNGDNMIRLVADLNKIWKEIFERDKKEQILAIRTAVIQGEFDGTKAEADRWFASKEGQDTLNELLVDLRGGNAGSN